MNKLNERLTLIANLSVVVGIIFLAVELQQNTQAIQAQTRDSITEKEMAYYGWVATNRDLAEVLQRGNPGSAELNPVDASMQFFALQQIFREYENSYYQYEQGLFTSEELEARFDAWRGGLRNQG